MPEGEKPYIYNSKASSNNKIIIIHYIIQCVSMAGTICVSMGLLVIGIYKCTLLVEKISMFVGIGERFKLCGWLVWWIALCMCHVIDLISIFWFGPSLAYALKFFLIGRHSLNLAKWTLVLRLFCQIMKTHCVSEL